MNMAQKQQFTDRISRIHSGGPNTFGTTYCGVQDPDTPKGKTPAGVVHKKTAASPVHTSSRGLMRKGLFSGVLQVITLSFGAVLYVTYVGL